MEGEQKQNNIQSKAADKVELQPLRTFQDDVKNVIQNQNITTSKIVLAEQKKKEDVRKQNPVAKQPKPKKEKGSNKKFVTMFLSIIFLGLGLAAIYYSFTYLKPYFENKAKPAILEKVDFLSADKQILIESKGKTVRQLIGEIRDIIKERKEGDFDDLIELVIAKEVKITQDGIETTVKEKIGSKDFFTLTESNAPDSLKRSLSNQLFIGLHKKGPMHPFIIMKTNYIDNTYAGMLAWEKDMIDDVRDIFFENLGSSQIFSGEVIVETSSTTKETINEDFIDMIVSNKDARGVVDLEGKPLFFYSIVDNEHLILTTNKDTLDLVLNRMNVAKLVR